MITSAENREWPSDVEIKNIKSSGLPAASIIRTTKIATIERRYAERLGKIDKVTLRKVLSEVSLTLHSALDER